MDGDRTVAARDVVEAVYRSDSRRVLATLIRLLGDFDFAEEALHEAFAAAVERWPREGVPANPRAWLVSTGRFKAIDALRRRARFDSSLAELAREVEARESRMAWPGAEAEGPGIEDDRLRLIFICCHPGLPPEAQLPLTLREVCGLTTEEIARAFLAGPSAIAQRIVRSKARIREEGLSYELPTAAELPERLDAALGVVYLLFNEGYSATSGDSLTRPDLSGEAIRLGRLLVELLPDSEALGLLALMLLQESRRAARAARDGSIILLPDQDRGLWDRRLIAEGMGLLARARTYRRLGPYAIQAEIAAVHAEATDAGSTDWARIVRLYDLLDEVDPSPVVELNRAVAVAMRDGPEAGLALVEALMERGGLEEYYLAHSARADFCRRLGRVTEARRSYERAIALARLEPERRFLRGRLEELAG